jgi:integrase
MDVVSKLLGHSKLQTTQDHYGKIVESRIAREMERLKGSDSFLIHCNCFHKN